MADKSAMAAINRALRVDRSPICGGTVSRNFAHTCILKGSNISKGASSISTEDNLAIVHRYLDEVVNTGNLDAARNLFATDHVAHYAGYPALKGHEDWKQLTGMSYSAFPDTYTTFEDEMAMGDKVVVRYTVRATHKGAFMDMPATGKTVKYSGIAIFRIANGKIVEQWQEADVVGLLQQLGERTSQTVTEPLGRQQTEALQHQREATPPIEEVR